ncbi:MAG: dicarboxylate/amino acid:cation symporter [Desulfovibrionaceae bacterium]
MSEMEKSPGSYMLLVKIVLGLLAGIAIGYIHNEVLVRLLLTFNAIFGQILSFVIPLLVLAFVTAGIAELGRNAGKLLGITVVLSFSSTLLIAAIAFTVGEMVLPSITAGKSLVEAIKPDGGLQSYISPQFPAVMGVISALILSFVLGTGIAVTGATTLLSAFREFQEIIKKVISNIIIPLLPFYIAGVFANITYSGEVMGVMGAFAGVFAMVLALHFTVLVILFTIAGIISKKNPFVLLRNMLPAYFTALGTQSSAATIPVTLNCMRENGVKERVSNFVAPLCANIHMSGSITTITVCALAVIFLSEQTPDVMLIIQFVLALAFAMVASPGVPGGSVFAALPFLTSILGFNENLVGLMIALYITQDSFGTACNVTGDGAIAVMVNAIADAEEAKSLDVSA